MHGYTVHGIKVKTCGSREKKKKREEKRAKRKRAMYPNRT